METTITIRNQNSSENLLTMLLKDKTPEFLRGSTILGFLEGHINECRFSESKPGDQLELTFTKRISISKEDSLDLLDLHLKGTFYSELEELLINHCGTDTRKQKEFLQDYINKL